MAFINTFSLFFRENKNMKHQALFSSIDKSKTISVSLAAFFFFFFLGGGGGGGGGGGAF